MRFSLFCFILIYISVNFFFFYFVDGRVLHVGNNQEDNRNCEVPVASSIYFCFQSAIEEKLTKIDYYFFRRNKLFELRNVNGNLFECKRNMF